MLRGDGDQVTGDAIFFKKITGSALHVLLNCCYLHLSTEVMPTQECSLLGFWENSPGLTLGDTGMSMKFCMMAK